MLWMICDSWCNSSWGPTPTDIQFLLLQLGDRNHVQHHLKLLGSLHLHGLLPHHLMWNFHIEKFLGYGISLSGTDPLLGNSGYRPARSSRVFYLFTLTDRKVRKIFYPLPPPFLLIWSMHLFACESIVSCLPLSAGVTSWFLVS